jgi:hypothetical protein
MQAPERQGGAPISTSSGNATACLPTAGPRHHQLQRPASPGVTSPTQPGRWLQSSRMKLTQHRHS